MYIYEKRSFKKTGLYIVFDAGSTYEAEYQKGCHHLMEHLICQTFKDQYDTLQKYNIDFNAFTSEEHVVVHFTGMEKYFTHDMKKLLIDRVVNKFEDYVTEESFENEKKTVYQEYLDTFNDPVEGAFMNILREHFGTYSVIGRGEDILNFSLADAKKLFKTLFKPSRIIEVGPTKTEGVKVKYKADSKTATREPAKLKWKKNYKFDLQTTPEGEKNTVFAMCKKTVSRSDYPYVAIGLSMLTSGLNSPLYKEIREKRGLSYFSSGAIERNVNQGILYLTSATDKAQIDELVKVYENVLKNIKKYLLKKDFNNEIDAITIMREEQKLLRFANCGNLVNKGSMMIPKNLKKITYDKVVEVMQKYASEFEIIVR